MPASCDCQLAGKDAGAPSQKTILLDARGAASGGRVLTLLGRELRVRARQPALYRGRCWHVLGWAALSVWSVGAPQAMGLLAERVRLSFNVVAAVAGAGCAVAGLRHMAVWFTREQQNRTWDALQQANVSAPALLWANFATQSIRSLQTLLLAAPFLLLPQAVGVVGGGQLGRVGLALAVLLFVSLALTALGGTLAGQEREALRYSVLALFAVHVGLPLAACLAESLAPLPGWAGWLASLSPAVLLREALHAVDSGPAFYQAGLAQVLAGLGCLFWADCWLRRRQGAPTACLSGAPHANPASATQPADFSRSALVLLPWAAFVGLSAALWRGNRATWEWCLVAFGATQLYLKVILALEASIRLREARQVGTLIPELATRLSPVEVVQRHYDTLVQQFRGPVRATTWATIATLVLLIGHGGIDVEQKLTLAVLLLAGATTLHSDRYGLCWVGLWLGLKLDRPGDALLQTLGRVVLLPWAGVWALSALNLGSFLTLNEYAAYFFCWLGLSVGLSLGLGAAAKHRLAAGCLSYAQL